MTPPTDPGGPGWVDPRRTPGVAGVVQRAGGPLPRRPWRASWGIELALDDFGTGYSSLAYLKRIPFGKLKIDRSFARDLEVDPDDRAIASTILSMGRSLRLKVLAEGVETAEQYEILRGMGCELVQGYHFSRPLPPEQFVAFLEQRGLIGKKG